MNKKKDLKILKFPSNKIEAERQVEAILFAAEEPLDEESVRDILDNEASQHENQGIVFPPSVVQFGGQTAINLSQSLDSSNIWRYLWFPPESF